MLYSQADKRATFFVSDDSHIFFTEPFAYLSSTISFDLNNTEGIVKIIENPIKSNERTKFHVEIKQRISKREIIILTKKLSQNHSFRDVKLRMTQKTTTRDGTIPHQEYSANDENQNGSSNQ